MVPASVDEKVYSGVVSLVGVVTAVTSSTTGAVVSVAVVSSEVVVVEEESLPEPPPPQPIIRINDSNRIENEKKNEKVSFRTLLYLKINKSILSTFKGFFNGLFSINGCLSC